MFHVKHSQMIKHETCPVCESNNIKSFLKIKDYSISKEEFQTENCNDCGFLFTNPIPSEETIGPYYESDEYISHSGTQKGVVSKLYHQVRKINLSNKYNTVRSENKGKNILDYGCGTGEFLSYCKERGYQTTGVEPNETARNHAVNSFGLEVKLPSDLNTLQDNHFDVITLWHVLEHVHQLKETIALLKQKLKDGGTLIIAVPNHISYDAKVFKDKWAAYDVPRHLYHFEPKTMSTLLEQFGFKIKKTLPMLFDSFYVSMLSSKYQNKGSIASLIKGFLVGAKSNLKANKTNQAYSSLIYIITQNGH